MGEAAAATGKSSTEFCSKLQGHPADGIQSTLLFSMRYFQNAFPCLGKLTSYLVTLLPSM